MFGTAQSHPSIQLAGIHVSHLAKNKNKCTQNLTTEVVYYTAYITSESVLWSESTG